VLGNYSRRLDAASIPGLDLAPPRLQGQGEISHHIVWHSLFYQLQFHPRWEGNYASQYDHAVYDDLPQVAAKRYLLRNPPPDPQRVYLTEDHQYLQVAASETYIRKAFFEFFSNDPAFVLETYLIYTPAKIFRLLGALIRSLPQGIENERRLDSSNWMGMTVPAAVSGLCCIGRVPRPRRRRFAASSAGSAARDRWIFLLAVSDSTGPGLSYYCRPILSAANCAHYLDGGGTVFRNTRVPPARQPTKFGCVRSIRAAGRRRARP